MLDNEDMTASQRDPYEGMTPEQWYQLLLDKLADRPDLQARLHLEKPQAEGEPQRVVAAMRPFERRVETPSERAKRIVKKVRGGSDQRE
jgi:hypothetical protein